MQADGRASASSRGYNARWRKARATFLISHPLCAECERRGRVSAASVVDHITPHRGDQSLFWSSDNWQSLCKRCHDSHKQSVERGGKGVYGCGVDGLPLDPKHPWNDQ